MSAHGLEYTAKELLEKFNERKRQILQINGVDYEGATTVEAYQKLIKAFYKKPIADPKKHDWPIPSGNVYLAQLMAHDLIQTIETGCPDVPYENLVRRPLMLETLYGRDPDVQPMLYQICERCASGNKGPVFRPKFRLGTICSQKEGGRHGLDLPRATECTGPNGAGVQSCDPNFTWREAIIADRRNDSHTILAQVTAVWMLFHNCVFEELLARHSEPSEPKIRGCFTSAKRIVAASWHAVIRNDILPIILKDHDGSRDPQLGENCKSAAVTGAGEWMDPFTGLPSAEARIALRCLHCLPRTHYAFASGKTQELAEVLEIASERDVGSIDGKWIINWRAFFDFGDDARIEHKTRYVAEFARDLTRGHDGVHLLQADLERVLEILNGPDADGRLTEFVSADFVRILEEALIRVSELPDTDPSARERIARQRAQITKFPPLLIFLMTEAAGEEPPGHLGPCGTRLLSPWLLGALEQAEKRICLTQEEAALVKTSFVEILVKTKQV